jgi:hypothetical protein
LFGTNILPPDTPSQNIFFKKFERFLKNAPDYIKYNAGIFATMKERILGVN